MEFTIKDFEVVGDTIERQKKLILAFEQWIGATILCFPSLQEKLNASKITIGREFNILLDNYIDQRRKEFFHKKGLDKE